MGAKVWLQRAPTGGLKPSWTVKLQKYSASHYSKFQNTPKLDRFSNFFGFFLGVLEFLGCQHRWRGPEDDASKRLQSATCPKMAPIKPTWPQTPPTSGGVGRGLALCSGVGVLRSWQLLGPKMAKIAQGPIGTSILEDLGFDLGSI